MKGKKWYINEGAKPSSKYISLREIMVVYWCFPREQLGTSSRRGLRGRGVGLAPLWTCVLSTGINHSLYHSCSIWSHNHYPTAEKEMKPLTAQGAELSVRSRKVFIKISLEKWFFTASLPGHATQKLDVLQQLPTTHPPVYRTNIFRTAIMRF